MLWPNELFISFRNTSHSTGINWRLLHVVTSFQTRNNVLEHAIARLTYAYSIVALCPQEEKMVD